MRLRASFQWPCRRERLSLRRLQLSVVDVAALYVTTTTASGSGYMLIGAGCTKAEVATVDEVAIREAEMQGDWDGVQVRCCTSCAASLPLDKCNN
jgi:hypothetical protein